MLYLDLDKYVKSSNGTVTEWSLSSYFIWDVLKNMSEPFDFVKNYSINVDAILEGNLTQSSILGTSYGTHTKLVPRERYNEELKKFKETPKSSYFVDGPAPIAVTEIRSEMKTVKVKVVMSCTLGCKYVSKALFRL